MRTRTLLAALLMLPGLATTAWGQAHASGINNKKKPIRNSSAIHIKPLDKAPVLGFDFSNMGAEKHSLEMPFNAQAFNCEKAGNNEWRGTADFSTQNPGKCNSTLAGMGGAGLYGGKDNKDKPPATQKADEKDPNDTKAAKPEDKTPAGQKEKREEDQKPDMHGGLASLEDFGHSFCGTIQTDPNSFSYFLAIRPLMRIGLELEFSKDAETKKKLETMGIDMEDLVDMGIEQSGIEDMEFLMLEDVGACALSSAETLDCSEIAKNLATEGIMGEDMIPEEITRIVLDAYNITECAVVTLKGDDGLINLGLLHYDGEWKIITLWD